MGDNTIIKVATPESVEAIKAEVDAKINAAMLGNISIEPITSKEIHEIFNKSNDEAE